MATTADDFSFPTTTNPPPLFIGSPPLWHRISSTPSPQKGPERKSPKGDDEERDNSWVYDQQRKSFSNVKRGSKEEKEDGTGDEEEKMDMLWEDLNEESSRIHGTAELCRVKGLKLSKTGGGGSSSAVFSGKRPGVVVLMKVLKRIFLLRNSHRTVNKRTG